MMFLSLEWFLFNDLDFGVIGMNTDCLVINRQINLFVAHNR